MQLEAVKTELDDHGQRVAAGGCGNAPLPLCASAWPSWPPPAPSASGNAPAPSRLSSVRTALPAPQLPRIRSPRRLSPPGPAARGSHPPHHSTPEHRSRISQHLRKSVKSLVENFGPRFAGRCRGRSCRSGAGKSQTVATAGPADTPAPRTKPTPGSAEFRSECVVKIDNRWRRLRTWPMSFAVRWIVSHSPAGGQNLETTRNGEHLSRAAPAASMLCAFTTHST